MWSVHDKTYTVYITNDMEYKECPQILRWINLVVFMKLNVFSRVHALLYLKCTER
jgi:hypothetical protein